MGELLLARDRHGEPEVSWQGLRHPEVIGYFPWRCAADVPSETYHDEARKIFDREHLRAGKTPRNAQTRDRSRDRPKYAGKRTASTHPGSAGRRFVLVHGLHRLEACRALGEETIFGYLTQAPKH